MENWFYDPTLLPTCEEIPFPTPNGYHGLCFGDGSYLLRWERCTSSDAITYCDTLQNAGFLLLHTDTLGEARFWRLEDERFTLDLSHYPACEEMRLHVEAVGSSQLPPTAPPEYEVRPGITPTLWQLPIDWKGACLNGGMSYVLRLSDGSFFVIDGGYDTDAEADALYTLLRREAGEDPIVLSGWFLSHLHGDHYGCFLKFAPRYAKSTRLDALYYNFPPHHPTFSFQNDFGVRVEQDVLAAAAHWEDVRVYRKLRTGMHLYHADMIADVLFTHEDLDTVEGINHNDTSTVLRIRLAGQRLLFPCDAQEPACRMLEKQFPAEEFRADIVQFSHHGYEGATREFYDRAAAPTVLWPMNIYGWQPGPTRIFAHWKTIEGTRLQAMPNRYICEEAPYVKKIIVGGEGLVALPLPYTPVGEKLPDYERIHDEIARREQNEAN